MVIRRVLLALVLVGVAAFALPASVSAMDVSVPYKQTFTNDSSKTGVADTFEYRLTAADAKSPLPAGSSDGSYDFSLTGNTSGDLALDFAFEKPGYYNYKVKSHVTSKKKGYTYDSQTYSVMIMVVNGADGLENAAVIIQDPELAKYDSLAFTTRYYIKDDDDDDGDDDDGNDSDDDDNGGGDNGGGDNGGDNNGGGGNGTNVTGPTDGGNDDGTTTDPTTTVDDTNPPKAAYDENRWALLNLIMMILTIITAVLGLVFYIRRRIKAHGQDSPEDDSETGDEGDGNGDTEDMETPQQLRRKGLLRALMCVVAVVSLIVFILTEDMTLPMKWVDQWTIWMIIFFLIGAILAIISRKVTKQEEEYDRD